MDETLSRDADAAARIVVRPVRSAERASTETWNGAVMLGAPGELKISCTKPRANKGAKGIESVVGDGEKALRAGECRSGSNVWLAECRFALMVESLSPGEGGVRTGRSARPAEGRGRFSPTDMTLPLAWER
jgi:hypothetical protein